MKKLLWVAFGLTSLLITQTVLAAHAPLVLCNFSLNDSKDVPAVQSAYDLNSILNCNHRGQILRSRSLNSAMLDVKATDAEGEFRSFTCTGGTWWICSNKVAICQNGFEQNEKSMKDQDSNAPEAKIVELCNKQ